MNKRGKQNRAVGQIILACLVVGAGFGIMGCGTTPKSTDKSNAKAESVFYPAAPDTPRLQFLVSFSDDSLWKEKESSSFSKWVVGEPDTESPTYFDSPYGLEVHEGKLYICDIGRKIVHVLDLINRQYKILGTEKTFKNPVNITIDENGMKYVCDTIHRKILVYDQNDQYVGALGDPEKCLPMDVVPIDGKLVVANVEKGQLELWSKTGELLKILATKGDDPDQLGMPTNLDVTKEGNILVTDTMLQMVKVFDIEGRLVGTIGNPGIVPGFFARPKGVAVAPGGVVYVADAQWEVIEVFREDGKLLMFFGGASSKPQGMGMPAGVVVDKTALPAFAKYVDPRFDAQYLLFVANQFGKNKIAVFAYGVPKVKIDRPLPETALIQGKSKPKPKAMPDLNITPKSDAASAASATPAVLETSPSVVEEASDKASKSTPVAP